MKILLLMACVAVTGCIGKSDSEVVVYCALDKEFSESILDDFQRQKGTTVLPKFDQESNKTVGLANEIIEQSKRQRCDVFWNNEILHTLRLQKLGLLEVYSSPLAESFPSQFVSAHHDWYGFAARARVLIVNTNLIPDPADRPSSIMALADPQWKDNCGIAKPLFGTTATHAAVLFATWGNVRARKFLSAVADNAKVEGGNKRVAMHVAQGRYAFGLTDTDDAIIEIEQGNPVAIVYPDQQPAELGALLIPNTLCILKDGPNTETAKKLIDFLLDQSVEASLARGRSAQIPLNPNVNVRSRVEPKTPLKIMEVDFQEAAEHWDTAAQVVAEIFAK